MANKKFYSIRQRTHDGVDNVMDGAENMRERGEEAMNNLKERAILIRENTDGYIKENPEKSTLIAAGIGAVIGSVLTALVMRRR